MSRLDTFILRLQAQRACIAAASAMVAGLAGPVFELGLGNGRTYDHLRTVFPKREVFVFERRPEPHPECLPDAAHLIVGELTDTLLAIAPRGIEPAVFIHSDIGTADDDRNARLARWLAGVLPSMLALGGIVASDQRLEEERLSALPLPLGVEIGRYHMYRLADRV